MKKIFYSLLAIAAFTACAKTSEEPAQIEIKLAPYTKLQTKAEYLGAVDGTTYPSEELFDVYAYWKDVPAGETFTDGVLYLRDEDNERSGAAFVNKNGEYWGGVKMYFWPKVGSLRFAAYSPSHLDVAHSQLGDVYSISDYYQPAETDKTWDFLVAPTSPSYSMMTEADKVVVDFKHALSWITLKVLAKDSYAAQAFEIKKVTILQVNTKADFAASMTDGIQYEEWTNQRDLKDIVVFDGSQKVTQTLTDIETNARGTIVIPQPTTKVKIDFVQHGINGTTTLPNLSLTLDLDLQPQGTPWVPGKHYNYKLIFSVDEILIKPTVSDWFDVDAGEYEIE